jgi:acetolactate synthase I/II/III large subunit
MAEKVRVSDIIAQVMADKGVTKVFMLTGGGAMHLNDAIGHHPAFEIICCHHEQALSMAADAYARITGVPACVNVTTGPGGINAINGVFGAYTDSLPMIIVSGQVKRETLVRSTGLPLRQLGDQEVDIVAMVTPVTKMAEVLDDPLNVLYVMEKAMWLATSGRPGPVWIDVPIDVQAMLVDPETLRRFDPATEGVGGEVGLPMEIGYMRGAALEALCVELLDRLKTSVRPVILAGSGVRMSGSHAMFLKLIDRLGIPVTTAWNAHDVLENSHPLYAGRPGSLGERAGNFIVQNSDLCIVLGSRLNIRQVSYNFRSFARKAFIVMVDIDRAEMLKPTLSIDMPVHANLNEMIAIMLRLTEGYRAAAAHQNYVRWAKSLLARYPVVLDRHRAAIDSVNPYVFVEKLFAELAPDEVIVTADGTACVVTFQAADIKSGQRLFHNSGAASMGYDLPAAIGACYTSPPNNRVVCIAGDGSVMQNVQELQTISSKILPVKLIILNNNGYHSIRQAQTNYFAGRSVGCGPESGISFPDFGDLAKAFGLPYWHTASQDELPQKVRELLNAPGPGVLEVVIDQLQVFEPRAGSRRLDDGSMVTSPLEDLSPLLAREELAENMVAFSDA